MVGVQINPVCGLPSGFPVMLFSYLALFEAVSDVLLNIVLSCLMFLLSRNYFNLSWITLKLRMWKCSLRFMHLSYSQ